MAVFGEGNLARHTQRRGHVMMEAAFGVMQSQTQESLEPPGAAKGRQGPLEAARPCGHLDLRLVASRAGREQLLLC